MMDPQTSQEARKIAGRALTTSRTTRTVNAQSSIATQREYPLLQRTGDSPVLRHSEQAAGSIYYPQLVDRWENPAARATVPASERYALLYSTDHAGTHSSSGIYWATAPHPTAKFTPRGLLLRTSFSVGGQQCETPNAVWFPPGSPGDISADKTGTWRLYFQLGNMTSAAGVSQATLSATAAEIAGPWTDEAVIFGRPFPGDYVPGVATHSGYGHIFRADGQLIGIEIGGGSRFGYRQWRCPSGDGVTWQCIPQRMGRAGHLTQGMPGFNQQTIYAPGRVIERRGRWWQISLIGASAAAGLETVRYLVAAPLGPDLMTPVGRPVRIDPPLTWEAAGDPYLGLDGFGFGCTDDDGRMFVPVRAGGKQGAFGVFEIV